jgi:cell division protein FtsB
MSVVVRANRRKSRPGSTLIMWLVLGLAVLFFLVRFGQEWLLEHELEARAAEQRIANARLRDENMRLKAALQYYQSDKYVEQRAREDLNLRRPDEEVLIPVVVNAPATGEGEHALPALGAQDAPTGMHRQEQANWRRWFDLFTPKNGEP